MSGDFTHKKDTMQGANNYKIEKERGKKRERKQNQNKQQQTTNAKKQPQKLVQC